MPNSEQVEQKSLPILKNYNIFWRFSNTHQKQMPYLSGKVYNDKRFPDGTDICTTAATILTANYAKTRNTEYILVDEKSQEGK